MYIENRLKFVEISNCRKRPQSNESLQITTEELRQGIKTMKNGRSFRPRGIIPELVKDEGDYLYRYLL